ncbi:MAG: hypothetical protein JXR29_03110 [Methylothermaceae bacterium]|nr:hypothetical protein [Methylothermaceae bacterium]
MPVNTRSISPDVYQTFCRILEKATGFRSGDSKPDLVANRLFRLLTGATNGSLAQLIRPGVSIENFPLTVCWNIAVALRSLAGEHSGLYYTQGNISVRIHSNQAGFGRMVFSNQGESFF